MGEYLRKVVSYLEYIKTKDGVKPNTQKVDSMINFPQPKNG